MVLGDGHLLLQVPLLPGPLAGVVHGVGGSGVGLRRLLPRREPAQGLAAELLLLLLLPGGQQVLVLVVEGGCSRWGRRRKRGGGPFGLVVVVAPGGALLLRLVGKNEELVCST